MARASNSSPSASKNSPFPSCARTFTRAARCTFSRISGSLRQPSSSNCLPSRSMISGLMSTSFSSGRSLKETSITVMRLDTPICGAARPMPWAAYMLAHISSTNCASSGPKSVTGAPFLESTGSGYFTIGWIVVPSASVVAGVVAFSISVFVSLISKSPNLFAVAVEVALQLVEAVAAELLEHEPRDGECNHGLACDACCRDDTDVRPLVRCLRGLARFERDRTEGTAQRRDGLQVAAHYDIFPVRHTAFDAACVVFLAAESREAFVGLFVFSRVCNRVVDFGAGRFGCGDAAAKFDGLDGLQTHQRLREQTVEALVPVDVRADAGRKAVHDDLEDAADGVAGAESFIDLGLHCCFGFGVGAGEQYIVALGDCSDFVEGNFAGELRSADAY